MITYLPEIYPDELVYSWFCRYYIHSGCFTHSMALKELLYNRCNNPSKEFIGHLNPDAEKKIKEIYNIDELIMNHTMFPQYARFIPLEQKKKALYHLGHDFCDAHHLFCILPRNDNEQYLRFCPLCAMEDREKYGETYWHRKHQIRNMNICTKHKCKLEQSDVTAKSEQTFILCPAENHVYDKEPIIVDNPLLIQFSEYIEYIFDAHINFNDIHLCAILYHGMSKTKYLKSTGRTRYTKMLADDIKEYYTDLGISNIASLYQIQRTLLGNRFDFSVVCQIAFFLGMTIEELINPSLTKEQIEQEQNSHYMKDITPIDWNQFDKDTAPMLEKIVKDIYYGYASDIGRPERVSEKIVYRELDLLGHRLENMPICKSIFEKYTESYPESWARRIIWSYNKLKEEKENFYWSDIRLLSGVKKHNVKTTIPFLSKHADKETFDAIINLVGELE